MQKPSTDDEALIPTGWVRGPLKQFTPLQRGFDLPTTQVQPGLYPVVYSNGLLRSHVRHMVDGPGVVTGRSGTIGRVHFVDRDFWPHNTTLWVTSFARTDPKFAYYLLVHVGLGRFASGSGVPTLNRNDAHSFEVTVPAGREEQIAIAQVLTDADDQIAMLEKLIAKKQAIKKGVMQELLTGKTRLPGFTTEWRSKRLFELLSYEQPGPFLVRTSKQLESGRVPVLTAGKTFVLGYTNESDGIYRAHPVIIFDDFTTASKYVDFDFKAKSSAMKILSARAGATLRFIYERMQLIDFPLGDHKRYWISEYSQQALDVPDEDEQNAIAAVIKDCSDEIDFLSLWLSKARAIRQGMMQELLTGRSRLPVRKLAA